MNSWEVLYPRGGGGLPYKRDGDARRLALGCKLQILVTLRVFEMESHYICPFRYHLGLCIKKFTKNALTLATQKSPLEFSLSFSHTHFGLPKGFNWNFPPIVTVTFLWESTRPPGFCMFYLPFVSSQSTQWVMLTVAKENPRRPVLNESPGQPLFEKLCVIKNRLNVFFFS